MAYESAATPAGGGDTVKSLTTSQVLADLKLAHQSKRKLIEREKEDFLFALGKQWSDEDLKKLEKAGVKPVTDNRIAPNLYLLTGLERQNRTDFKAFPKGDEDGLKADVASVLFKDAIEKSGFQFESSDQFKDGITCGESHLELYLDYTDSIINGKPCWKKLDGNAIFPDPTSRKYDFSDARYVYKLTLDVAKEDLIGLYPEMEGKLKDLKGGRFDLSISDNAGTHRQQRDYGGANSSGASTEEKPDSGCFDLLERFYKKYVPAFFVADRKTGQLTKSDDETKAQGFIENYRAGIQANAEAYQGAVGQAVSGAAAQLFGPGVLPDPAALDQIQQGLAAQGQLPPAPPEQDPERFTVLKRLVPEIWVFAMVPGLDTPLVDERAWFYPHWKSYPFAPFFARFSTAPITGDDRHLLVQGLVHGVKAGQEMHNKAKTLMIRHLNGSANSGWLSEEDVWVDAQKVEMFGTAPGVNLEYKQGRTKPERITPTPLSPGHAELSADTAESIKAQLGINSDLLATQQAGGDSGRAIALRQKQGLLMVQEPFDNLSRTRQIAGRFLLSQLGEIYDTDSAMKVLGEAFLTKNFPPIMLPDPANQGQQVAAPDKTTGQPMQYDREVAELIIAEVLSGNLEQYDVAVGEAVASETAKMAVAAEIKELSQAYPGVVQADTIVKNSMLPEAAKKEILSSLQMVQAQAAAGAGAGGRGG